MAKTTKAQDELDYATEYAKREESGFTALQEYMGEWVADKTQAEFKTAKELAAFKQGVATALWLRMPFQRSDECKAFNEAKRNGKAEEEAATKAARAADKAKRTAERAAAAAKPKPAKAPATDGVAKRGPGRPKAATKPATPAGRPARRPAASGKPGRPARKAEVDF